MSTHLKLFGGTLLTALLLSACGSGGESGAESGAASVAEPPEATVQNPSKELGPASGYWTEWQQTQEPRKCVGKDCFYNRRGDHLSGVPFIVKGFSTEMDLNGFVAVAEGNGGQLAELTYPPKVCGDVGRYGWRVGPDEECRKFFSLDLTPPKWLGEKSVACCEVYRHREKVAYSFEDQTFTLGGLPIKYAFYNYVESVSGTDPDEKQRYMARYIALGLAGTEGDLRALSKALDGKFMAKRGADVDIDGIHNWGFFPMTEGNETPAADFDVSLSKRLGHLLLVLQQRETHTRLPAVNVDETDL